MKHWKIILLSLAIVTLIGCEINNHNTIENQSYTQLDHSNAKDQDFYLALEKNLKNLGSVVSVSANTEELNLYRQGKRPYPTNYRYEIKTNPKVSLENIKQANLDLK